MDVSVTGLGAAFLLVATFCLLFRRVLLLPLLGLGAVMQAPSAANLILPGVSFGLGPYMLATFAMTLHLIATWRRVPIVRLRDRLGEPAVRLWVVFWLLGAASIGVGPLLFGGTGVYVPLDKLGVDGAPSSLGWTVNHAAQGINVLLIGALFLWVIQRCDERALPAAVMRMALAALGIALIVGLQQRLAWNGLVPLWADFWASNPTYAQDYDSLAGAVPRVSWPFVDPSYASAFFAAMFGGFLTMFLAGQRTNAALLGLMVSLFALGNTLGATGSLAVIVVVVLAAAAVLVVAVRRPALAGALAYRVLLLSLAASCVALGGFLVLRHYDLLGVFGEAMRNALAGRSQTFLGDIRPHADLMSLKLLVETWGLGVGMGSHRGSSYLITLAANTGVLGLVAFLAANVMHFTLLTKRFIRHPDAPSAFFLGSGLSVLIAVSIAIPDQNWPVYWILILGGFACIICPVEDAKAARRPVDDASAESPDQVASRAG
jgi:hypothetical protein